MADRCRRFQEGFPYACFAAQMGQSFPQVAVWSALSPASVAPSAGIAGRRRPWDGLLLRRRLFSRRRLGEANLAFEDEPVVAVRDAINYVLGITVRERHQPHDAVQAMRRQRG